MRLPQRAGLVRSIRRLRATDDPDHMLLAGRFLLLLNRDTWTSRSTLDLVNDLVKAVRLLVGSFESGCGCLHCGGAVEAGCARGYCGASENGFLARERQRQ